MKIRAWDEGSGEFAYSDNVEQDYYSWGFDRNGEVACYYEVVKRGNSEFDPPETIMEEVSGPYELWSTVQDKKGVDLYGGDIVDVAGRIGVIVWQGAGFHIDSKDKGIFWSYLSSWIHDNGNFVKKIGDIHTTPELLEAAEEAL